MDNCSLLIFPESGVVHLAISQYTFLLQVGKKILGKRALQSSNNSDVTASLLAGKEQPYNGIRAQVRMKQWASLTLFLCCSSLSLLFGEYARIDADTGICFQDLGV